MKETKLIGQMVEYEAGGRLYIGRVVDKFSILSKQDNGQELAFDLYLISMPNGKTYKISPVAIKKIL